MPISTLSGRSGRSGRSDYAGRSGRSGRSGDYSTAAHVGGEASPLLSQALMFSQDGIVGTGDLGKAPGGKLGPERPEALAILAPEPRGDVLDFELIEQLAFYRENENEVHVRCCNPAWNGTKRREFETLVTITRPKFETLQKQAELVRGYGDLRSDRLPEIFEQIDDLYSFFGAIDFLGPERTKWTLELMAAAVRLSIAVEMRLKHALNCPRPILFSDRIQPVIQTPTHGPYPSGHATEAYAIATVLTLLFDAADGVADLSQVTGAAVRNMAQRYRLAARIAINRTVAGVHFPVDSAAGAILGITLGEFIAARATGKPASSRVFNGSDDIRDFTAGELARVFKEGIEQSGGKPALLGQKVESPNIKWVWDAARVEIGNRWGA